MEFNIDPKDLSLQDAAGMQLVEVIRNLADESGTADYENLENLPKINGVTLKGDKSSDDLHIAVSDEQVTEAVDAWLEDNVDPETGYVLDSTLTMSNAAAPADKVGELKSETSQLDNAVFETTNETIPLDTETGAYLASTKEYWSNSGYQCAIIEATSTDKIYISTKTASTTTIPVALFYNGTPGADTYISLYGEYTEETVLTNVLLPIPEGTTHIVLNCRGFVDPFTAYKTITRLNADIRNGNILAKYTSGTLTLRTRYTPASDIIITIGKGGGNNLVDFREIKEIKNSDNSTVFTWTQSTDWFSPYMIRASENADGDMPEGWYGHFTGGNHQYNNTGSGSTATARCTIDKVLFDGKDAVSDGTYCERVEMWWTNYIQGQNTKKADGTGREILEEKYHLVFDGFAFNIEHYFIPLEDVLIRKYYGLQASWNINLSPMYNFIGGTSRKEKELSASDVNCGNKSCRDFYVIDNLNNRLQIHMDGQDIGDFELSDMTYSAFQSYFKVYFSLIDGNDYQAFALNDMYFNSGKIEVFKQQ